MDIDAGGKTPISLPDDIRGIIGLRSWNVNENSKYISSLFAEQEWKGPVQQTATPTSLPGDHGFYAYRLTSRIPFREFYSSLSRSALYPATRIQVHGLVELRGRVIEHDDDIVRGEWCRILCFFLPVTPAASEETKRQIRQAGWLHGILAQYGVPVYLTDTGRFRTIFERLVDFERDRMEPPEPVEYRETRPDILKKVDELIDQVNYVGVHIPFIYLNRQQMREFKDAISRQNESVDSPVIYKRVRIVCTSFDDGKTPYMMLDVRSAG